MRSDFTPLISTSFQIWDHFFSLLFPNDSENLKSLDIGLRAMGAKRRLSGVNKWKNPYKNFFRRGDFRPFLSKNVQIWDQFFPLFFPKDCEYLKSLDIGLWEVGAKRPLNGVNKWRKSVKNFFRRGNFTPLSSKKIKSETTSFHYFYPRILNN